MTTRWVLYFDEGNVVTTFDNDIEDMRMQDMMANQTEGFITFPAGVMNVYANLNKVKCITREIVEAQPEAIPAVTPDEIPVVVPDLVE